MVEDAVICAQAVDQIYVVSVQSADAKCIGERCYVHAILKFPFMPAFLRVSSLRCYLQIVFQIFLPQMEAFCNRCMETVAEYLDNSGEDILYIN